jgi:hypothetical protein
VDGHLIDSCIYACGTAQAKSPSIIQVLSFRPMCCRQISCLSSDRPLMNVASLKTRRCFATRDRHLPVYPMLPLRPLLHYLCYWLHPPSITFSNYACLRSVPQRQITDNDMWEQKHPCIYSSTEVGPAMKTFHVVFVGHKQAHDKRTIL